MVAVELGNGQPASIGQLDESKPQAVRKWLASVPAVGAECHRQRDLMHDKTMADKLGLKY